MSDLDIAIEIFKGLFPDTNTEDIKHIHCKIGGNNMEYTKEDIQYYKEEIALHDGEPISELDNYTDDEIVKLWLETVTGGI